PLFYNEVWRKYLADVNAWKTELQNVQYVASTNPLWPYRVGNSRRITTSGRPYTIKGDAFQACVTVVNFDTKVAAQIQASRLQWNHPMWASPSACGDEWSRVDPAVTKAGLAMSTANLIVQRARNQLKSLFYQRKFCGTNRQQAEEQLATAVAIRVV